MNRTDSAKIQFFRVPAHNCCSGQCNQIDVQLTVHFGSLFPEIEADYGLFGSVKAPLARWIVGDHLRWNSSNALTAAGPRMKEWIEAARATVRGLTGREILDALESYKSIEVLR